MDKKFETWWSINKFRLMENEAVGLREIALSAYTASKQAAQHSVQADAGCDVCRDGVPGWDNEWLYCPYCGSTLRR